MSPVVEHMSVLSSEAFRGDHTMIFPVFKIVEDAGALG